MYKHIENGQHMDQIIDIFKKTGALSQGHFRLTSGLHSATYFQCARVLQYPEYCTLLAENISRHFEQRPIDVVIAPAVGGIVIGQEVGRQLNVRTMFSERENGQMTLRRGFSLQAGEQVLVCEDVVTTGGSVFEVLDIVRTAGAVPVGVGFIVDRSGGKVDFGTEQFSSVQLNVETFKPENCPLCARNEPIQKPGSRSV